MAVDGHHLLVVNSEESLNLARLPLSSEGDTLGGPEQELSDGLVRDRYPGVLTGRYTHHRRQQSHR